MNIFGKEYIKEQHKKVSDYNKYIDSLKIKQDEKKKLKYIISNITESSIMERLMRLGVEARNFDLIGDAEHRQVALATLIEDDMKKKDYYKTQLYE